MSNPTKVKFIAFIFARGGSKGIPKKNIIDFNGTPLIGLTISIALKSNYIDQVFVSTDDEEIAKIAEKYGAVVPFYRPSELASDSSKELDAWRHAIDWAVKTRGNFDAIISLPTTSPLRNVQDIDNCISKYIENFDSIDGVVTLTHANRHPSFNMVKFNQEGFLSTYSSSKSKLFNRQEAPKAYDLCTICYVFNQNYILTCSNLFQGKVLGVEVPKERSIDIDDEYDLKVARLIDKSNRK